MLKPNQHRAVTTVTWAFEHVFWGPQGRAAGLPGAVAQAAKPTSTEGEEAPILQSQKA